MARGIYKIENNLNHKIYIGQSVDIERRWKQHISSSNDVKHPLYYNQLYRDFRHYGIDNFTFSIVQEISEGSLDEAELYWMKHYDTLKNGYNISAGKGQTICLEEIGGSKLYFKTFKEVEKYLRKNQITTAMGLERFLRKAIKENRIIYNKYRIYYWSE